ncbi:MAG: hypothetical protein KDH15_04605 [Rhodocyclaceae bacterium]|nr:hypothetical protein [Rhodocyclaceae bacterium]
MSADALPEDSVLRRHAETERNRQLGLPPTDSVLKRHYAQLRQMAAAAGSASPAKPALQPAAKAAATPRAAATPAAAASAAPPRAEPAATRPAPSGGGLLGWLKRLLGA